MDRAPLPAEACPAVGNAYRRIGKYDLALNAFERCFQSDTKNAELAFFVGLGNEWLTRFGPAEEYYEPRHRHCDRRTSTAKWAWRACGCTATSSPTRCHARRRC